MKKMLSIVLTIVLCLGMALPASTWNMPTDAPPVITDPDYMFPSFSNGERLLGKSEINNVPVMGWNSWHAYGSAITESNIMATADHFVRLGLDDVGYEYVVMDDGCYPTTRGSDGKLSNNAKFPSGFKALADYIHSRGLKYGMYNDVGTKTCAGQAGLFGNEEVDAQSFADWDVDFLKVDFCYYPWDTATFSDSSNIRYSTAPRVRSISLSNNSGFSRSLNAVADGIVTDRATKNTSGNYAENLNVRDWSYDYVHWGELEFQVNVETAGTYDLVVEYAAGTNNGRWLQVAVGPMESETRYFDNLLPATRNNTTFGNSPVISIELEEGDNIIRLMNYRREENPLQSYAALYDGLKKAGVADKINLSICEWGKTQAYNWGYKVGNSWRIANDITFSVGTNGKAQWNSSGQDSILGQYNRAVVLDDYSGLDKGWNDPDMMVVGMVDSSTNKRFTQTVDISHFTLWCMLNSPLMLGIDLAPINVGDPVWQVISNEDVIALNQDALGVQAKRIYTSGNPTNPQALITSTAARIDVLAKPLANGDFALTFLNTGTDGNNRTATVDINLILEKIGHKMTNASFVETADLYGIKDLWTKESSMNYDGVFTATVGPQETKTFRVSPLKGTKVDIAPTVVEGLPANVSVDISGLEQTDLTLKLMNFSTGAVVGTYALSQDGQIHLAQAPAAGVYTAFIYSGDEEVAFGTLTVLAYDKDLWFPSFAIDAETGKLSLVFADQIVKSDDFGLTLNGSTITEKGGDAVDGILNLDMTLDDFSDDNQLIVSGINYSRLFPDFDFTFHVSCNKTPDGLTVKDKILTLPVGATAPVSSGMTQSDLVLDKNVVYTSSNPSVATIENGVVTAVATGEAIISASVAGKVLNAFKVSVYASQKLSSAWSAVRPVPSGITVMSDKSIKVAGTAGDMWNGWTNAENILLTTAPSGDFTLETILLTKPETNHATVALTAYAADSNYVSLVRRQHSEFGGAVFALNNQVNSSTSDSVIRIPDTFAPGAPVHLKLEKVGNVFRGYISGDGETWIMISNGSGSSVTNNNVATASNLRVGFHSQQTPGATIEWAGFKINGQPVSYATIDSAADIGLTVDGNTTAPVVASTFNVGAQVFNRTAEAKSAVLSLSAFDKSGALLDSQSVPVVAAAESTSLHPVSLLVPENCVELKLSLKDDQNADIAAPISWMPRGVADDFSPFTGYSVWVDSTYVGESDVPSGSVLEDSLIQSYARYSNTSSSEVNGVFITAIYTKDGAFVKLEKTENFSVAAGGTQYFDTAIDSAAYPASEYMYKTYFWRDGLFPLTRASSY